MVGINAGIGKTLRGKSFLKVVGYFIVWYIFGAISNIYCKEFLKATEDPVLLTLCQYLISVILTSSFLLYYNNTAKKGHDVMDPPSSFDIPNSALKIFVLIGVCNGIGHVMTNLSMGKMAVSFTHTLKASEPLFSLFFTFFLFKQRISKLMALSVLPIIIGTMLTTATEISYSHLGFITAVMSNILFSTRNVYSKLFQSTYPNISSTQLFLLLNVLGIFLLFPLWIMSSWYHHFYPIIITSEDVIVYHHDDAVMVAEGVVADVATGTGNESSILEYLILASITHCIYNMSSFLILEHITPVSHSIGNALRRVYIVIFAIVWFGNPMNLMNFFGTILALLGVVVYCYASAKYQESLEKRSRTKQVLVV